MKKEEGHALYRRYRSTGFDEVIGQQHVTELLKRAVETDNVSHAYLFTGPRGTGKTSVARILAFAVNKLPYDKSLQNLDIIEIDAASNRRIDDIRDLREKVHIAPVNSRFKVYIIDEVHMLTGESFNALLKTLEEPPAHVIFILATTEIQKVPDTIISRAQWFNFRPIARKHVTSHLENIAKQEKIDIDKEALEIIADRGKGSFRDSINLLDQLGSFNKKITKEMLEDTLGIANVEAVNELIKQIKNGNVKKTRENLQKILDSGVLASVLAEQIIKEILKRDESSTDNYEFVENLMQVAKSHFPELMLVSSVLKFASQNNTNMNQETNDATDTTATPKNTKHASAKLPKIPVKPEDKIETDLKAEQPTKPDSQEPKMQENPAKSSEEFDWEDLLDFIKKENMPLFSTLKHSTVNYKSGEIFLNFRYKLHKNKMEQPKYMSIFSEIIARKLGFTPKVIISDKNQAENETTKSVADIMGGGEAISL